MSIDKKKGIMFSSGDDFYVFVYSVLVVLNYLKCRNGNYFRDLRKIAYLIEILNDPKSISILKKYKGGFIRSQSDRIRLSEAYSRSVLRKGEVSKVIFSLEKRGYISLRRGSKPGEIDVSLNIESLPKGFLDADEFSTDKKNAESLFKSVPRISVLTFEKFIENLFINYGVKAWPV